MVGAYGCLFRNILASRGVLLPFLLLHGLHAVTQFSKVDFPPLETGIT